MYLELYMQMKINMLTYKFRSVPTELVNVVYMLKPIMLFMVVSLPFVWIPDKSLKEFSFIFVIFSHSEIFLIYCDHSHSMQYQNIVRKYWYDGDV